jgi:polyhydroxyalkanoate synthesis regulator phasin
MAERRKGSQAKRGGGTRRSSSGGARRSGQAKTRTTRSAAAKRGGQARGRQQTAQRRARRAAAAATSPAEFTGKTAAELREALTRSLIRPLDLMMLTRDRIEDAVNDAVERGQMTAKDAQELVQRLVSRGRKQTNDVLGDLEQLLGRGRGGAGTRARKQVEAATRGARSRAARATDPLLAQADRARRAAGIGPSFPITSYDDLTAAQVQSRLGDLSPAELRKVRDYERRHANRKSVLSAIETKLA